MNKDTIEINSVIYSLHPRHKSGDCGRVLSAKAQLEALISKKVKKARKQTASEIFNLAHEYAQKDDTMRGAEDLRSYHYYNAIHKIGEFDDR